MSGKITHFFFFLGLLLLGSCLDEIELDKQVIDAKAIIIQGRLLKGSPSLVEVSVQRVGDYDNSELSTFIGNAKISLLNGKGAKIDLQELRSPQIYRASIPSNNPNFSVQEGENYQIKVLLADGRQFESAPEPLLSVPDLEKTNFKLAELSLPDYRGIITPAQYLQFWVSTSLKAKATAAKAKLRWELQLVYRLTDNSQRVCYNFEPQRPDRFFLYDGPLYAANRLDSFFLNNIILDHRFAEGAYMLVIQEALSPEAFQYWTQAKTLAERTGNMFEAPPAKISSNIRNVQNPNEAVYGYFYPSIQDTVRLYINPAQVGFPQKYCPQPPTQRMGPTICDICTLQTGSTLSKPRFWVE
jgi:hypothetical protein